MNGNVISGLSLYLRLTPIRRAGTNYISPDLRIDINRQFADEHGSRLLWTHRLPRASSEGLDERGVEHLIVHSPVTNTILVGTIVGGGTNYDPATWNPDSFYQVPSPWDQEKSKQWIALDDVYATRYFQPEKYMTLASNDRTVITTLDDAINQHGVSFRYIRPISEATEENLRLKRYR